MIRYSEIPVEETFSQFAFNWFRLVARGEIDMALAAIDETTSYGIRWSADSIRQALLDYSPHATVTDPGDLPLDVHQNLITFTDGTGFAFDCSVPISGQWSDLTAQFEFLRRPNGFAVILEDLHVL
jgi:hypothetical protein